MFYVYENWRARGYKAKIHRGYCSFCNNGRGLTTGTRSDNGRWLGPFNAVEEAEVAAQQTGGMVSHCRCV